MRILIFGLLALLVLGGGGAGAYFYFMKSAEASIDPDAVEEHAEAEKGRSKKDDHGGGYSAAEFVELDPLILPIVDQNGVSQVVSLVIALEVPNSAAAAKVEHMEPKLKDAFIQDMYGVLNRHAALKGGVIQVSVIKKRLNRISTDIMGEEIIHDVLLQVVQQRPL